jgi:hypothetical protein
MEYNKATTPAVKGLANEVPVVVVYAFPLAVVLTFMPGAAKFIVFRP